MFSYAMIKMDLLCGNAKLISCILLWLCLCLFARTLPQELLTLWPAATLLKAVNANWETSHVLNGKYTLQDYLKGDHLQLWNK